MPDPDIEDFSPWDEFRCGWWQRTRPTRPGTYPVATREGMPAGHRELFPLVTGGVREHVGFGQPGWEGWWWSRPLPSMPIAGQW